MAGHDTFRFEIRDRGAGGPRESRLPADARAMGLGALSRARHARLIFVRGTMAPEELDLLGRFLFSDPVTEECSWRPLRGGLGPDPGGEAGLVVEVARRPGVADPVAAEIERAAPELGVAGLLDAATAERWELQCEGLDEESREFLVRSLLANPLVDRWAWNEIVPLFARDLAGGLAPPAVEGIPLRGLDDAGLVSLASDRRSALDLAEMRALAAHFEAEGRDPTDAEFEMVAQTWSEHCVHKTFKAQVEVDAGSRGDYPALVDGIFATYIKAPTDEIAAPWVLSAFVDNAGVIDLDGEHEVSFKVETHNHPSAVEPFGGANTGLGGVIRDIMGVSARPVAATDVLCFGPVDTPRSELPEAVIHPLFTARGVVAGIGDYGNKMGVPTVNGGLRFDPGYTANPLVYCGCVGLAPRGLRRREIAEGDRVIVLGGRTGRDGIRGATFSSMAMDSGTGEVAGASVQIGDPIAQKRALDVLLAARDARLYGAVTDCGAGGLSSAVGEMAEGLGVEVELDALGTKYEGLAPWELWLSESQERMVLAVPAASLGELAKLCALYGAGMWDIGAFTGSGRVRVRHRGEVVIDLPLSFLQGGRPRKRLRAAPGPRKVPAPRPRAPAKAEERLLALLARPGSASCEEVIRRYDHEVQGGTLLAPYDGPWGEAPGDAAVILPQGSSGRAAIALSNGFRPDYARLDPYRAAVSAHDEALRNLVAVGADPERVAVLDNFCMGDPARPEVMWDLLESARGLRDAVLAQRTPIVSGKDSFYNEYADSSGRRCAIPPSLLVSGIGIVPASAAPPGSWLKGPGDRLFLAGDFAPSFGGSLWSSLWREPEGSDPSVPGPSAAARVLYRALHRAIGSGLVAAAHDLAEGGLALALAEMCLGGRLGASLSLPDSIGGRRPSLDEFLFGETNGCLLLEVGARDLAAFLGLFEGLPIVEIGRTLEEGFLEAVAEGGGGREGVLRLELGAMARAWRSGAAEVGA